MHFANYIRDISRGAPEGTGLDYETAYRLYAAMLDGGIPDFELGAILIALKIKVESLTELLGFYQAVSERLNSLQARSEKLRTVVIPTYHGARRQANLIPLIAMWLARFGVPVLLHGTLQGNGRVGTAYILRELGFMPCVSLEQARQNLQQDRLAFLPTAVLAPGLNNLLIMRNRLGTTNSAHTLVRLIDPVAGQSLRMASVSLPEAASKVREFFMATEAHALLLQGTEGEAFANPKRRPRLEYFKGGKSEILFEAEVRPVRVASRLPERNEAVATAQWTKQVLKGEIPLPLPIANQLACLLYASAYTDDMNQAKAIVALETGCLAAA